MSLHLVAPLFVLVVTVLFTAPAAAQPRPGSGGPVDRVPPGVTARRDLAYVGDGHERQTLDVFVPETADGPLPLIIWIHGGGWQNGSKDGCPPLRTGFTERGYAVASINYRLSGHAVFPAQIEDCKAAIRWLRAHAEEYGLDPQRFGVWGSSAGGHLAARANPITYVSRDDPAFLIVHGDKDSVVPINQSQLLHDALKQVGVKTHFHTINRGGHRRGFGGPEIEPLVVAFFDRVLKAKPLPANLGPATTSASDAFPAPAAAKGKAAAMADRPDQTSASVRRGSGLIRPAHREPALNAALPRPSKQR